MQIVIDIPECYYEYCKAQEDAIEIQLAVKNGIPLPKGRGRLIDADDLDNHIIGHVDTRSCPTIIEADERGEECL